MADNIKTRHSSYINNTPTASVDTRTFSKSDIYVTKHSTSNKINENDIILLKNSCEEYYKRYRYDEMPFKEHSSNDNSYKEYCISGDTKDSLTNSNLDNLELHVLSKMSHELQTGGTSVESLESKIKLFKLTVQEIFDKFYDNMKDYEIYKNKYNEILTKKNDSVTEMDDFIKCMIQNIISSTEVISEKKLEICSALTPKVSSIFAVETYKNENYTMESADDSSNCRGNVKKEKSFNIYMLSVAPYIAKKLNNRLQLSEINIRDSSLYDMKGQIASAENITIIAAKKRQLETYGSQYNPETQDTYIPIKVSNPKKNISLNEDFVTDSQDDYKSLISKFCNYICRRFRKATCLE